MDILLVFAREPRPGRVKTRLAAAIGDGEAYRLYRAFLQDLAEHLGDVAGTTRIRWWVDGDPAGLLDAVGAGWRPHWEVSRQPDGHLGVRLETAFQDAFEMSPAAVAVIGTDCPQLHSERLAELFTPLSHGADAVLLPTLDGGYAGLALAALSPEVFQGVPWSTDRVTQVTLANLHRSGREVTVLPPVFDVDTAAELRLLRELLAAQPELAPHTATLLAHSEIGS